MINSATQSDIDRMVGLFTNYINNSFFAGLGEVFLKIFLKALVESRYALNFLYIIDSKIIGFISSYYDCSRLFRQIFIRKGFLLGLIVLISLFKKPVILKNLWEAILYVFRTMRNSIKAELLFIAIEPDFRLHGVATQLINYTLIEMKKRGIQKVRVSTDQSNAAVNRLLQKLGFEIMGSFQLFNKRMYLYNRQV